MTTILVLGAEKPAATSLAQAYPDCNVIFASDRDIIDGSDLSNVRMVPATPSDTEKLSASADHVVALCPRWVPGDHSLTTTLGCLEQRIPDRVVPVQARLQTSGHWIVKGNRWPLPDAPLSGTSEQLADVTDPYGCGLVYQSFCKTKSTVLAVGRRYQNGGILIGIIEVIQERFFRDEVLEAGETISAPNILRASIHVLETLDHRGFFSLNWLRTDNGVKLSSLRPVPRAIFQTFLRGGVDLLDAASSISVVTAGLRFVAVPNYVSFERLSR